jgi:hypothetical protein
LIVDQCSLLARVQLAATRISLRLRLRHFKELVKARYPQSMRFGA